MKELLLSISSHWKISLLKASIEQKKKNCKVSIG